MQSFSILFVTISNEVCIGHYLQSIATIHNIAHSVFGNPANEKNQAIAMTAPVITNGSGGTTIAMTAPVLSSSNLMSFILPSSIQDVAQAPVPLNPLVALRQIPQRDIAYVHVCRL